ncbi:MAG TPA: hypothetical protein VF781_01830 [Solirubrobacteraceae bacterium]
MVISPGAKSEALTRRAATDRFPPSALGFVLLSVVLLASISVVVVLGTRLTFFNDDWYFLLQRPGLESHGGLDVLLAPHNSNLVFLTAGVYRLLVAIFGLGSQVPFRAVLAVTIALVGVFVFLLVSKRAGQMMGLAFASIVVLLGAAWEDLLFFASVDLVGSLATGLAALWLLEREEPRRYLACFLLVCSVGFSNVGVPFALGAGALLLLRRRLVDLWVAAVPLAVFGLWWAIEGNRQPSHLSAHNVEHLPRYLLDSLTSGLASLTGVSRGTVPDTYTRGRIVLGTVAVLLIVALVRGWRPRASVLVPMIIAVSFWCLTGASFTPGREAFASRYQLIDVALLLIIGADLLGSTHLGRFGSSALVVLTIAAVSSNVADRLTYGYRFLREQSQFVKADLGALNIGRRLAPPNLWLVADIARNPYLSGVTAGRFFTETDAHGQVPVYTPQQIATASIGQRQGADNVLALADRLTPVKTRMRLTSRSECARLRTAPNGPSSELSLHPGAWLLYQADGPGLEIGVRRFAPPGSSAYIGFITPGLTERMIVPPDAISAEWKLSIKSTTASAGGLHVCPV